MPHDIEDSDCDLALDDDRCDDDELEFDRAGLGVAHNNGLLQQVAAGIRPWLKPDFRVQRAEVHSDVRSRSLVMTRLAFAILLASLTAGSAAAQSCATNTTSKDGKPLVGAAKASAVKKCCETAAVSKEGKPLVGAAKASFVKKCTSES